MTLCGGGEGRWMVQHNVVVAMSFSDRGRSSVLFCDTGFCCADEIVEFNSLV